jgi:hypothetical protein
VWARFLVGERTMDDASRHSLAKRDGAGFKLHPRARTPPPTAPATRAQPSSVSAGPRATVIASAAALNRGPRPALQPRFGSAQQRDRICSRCSKLCLADARSHSLRPRNNRIRSRMRPLRHVLPCRGHTYKRRFMLHCSILGTEQLLWRSAPATGVSAKSIPSWPTWERRRDPMENYNRDASWTQQRRAVGRAGERCAVIQPTRWNDSIKCAAWCSQQRRTRGRHRERLSYPAS